MNKRLIQTEAAPEKDACAQKREARRQQRLAAARRREDKRRANMPKIQRRCAKAQHILVRTAAALTVLVLVFLVGYILLKGIPYLKPSLFAWKYDSVNVSLLPALINTVLMVLLSLAISLPLGIGAAIYLVEYTGKGNKLVSVIRLTAETLTGIPSIVYGLFGMLFFVNWLKWKLSLLSGACTLAIMVLPVILRTTEEALKSVPDSYREGSFGLGAGRLGILAGVILAIGRIVGESAALIYTAGTVPEVASSLFDSTRTLAVHMYALSSEGLYIHETYATAVVLLVIVIGINALSNLLARRIRRRSE